MEKQHIMFCRELYDFLQMLAKVQSRISFDSVRKAPTGKTIGKEIYSNHYGTLDALLLSSLDQFMRSLPLRGDNAETIQTMIRKTVSRFVSRDTLAKEVSIGLTQKDIQQEPGLIYDKSTSYQFVSTMEIIDALIDRGCYPIDYYVYRPKTEKKVKPDNLKKWLARREHSITFLDFASLCNPQINGTFIEIYERTGLLPCIVLSTAHDGNNSFKLRMSLVDIRTGSENLMMAYATESVFGVRLVHHKSIITPEVIEHTLFDIVHGYKKLVMKIHTMQSKQFSTIQLEYLQKAVNRMLFGRAYEQKPENFLIDNDYWFSVTTLSKDMALLEDVSHNVIQDDTISIWDRMMIVQSYMYGTVTYQRKYGKGWRTLKKKNDNKHYKHRTMILGKLFDSCSIIIAMTTLNKTI